MAQIRKMQKATPTYIWRKLVSREWFARNEEKLIETTGSAFAVIERPTHVRLLVELACRSGAEAGRLEAEFGGRSEKLGRDWLNEMLRGRRTKPIRIADRLLVTSEETATPNAKTLVIPAGAAFGTGEHATTAMSLRLLERLTRKLPPGWRMLDAGSGSGILAFAGQRFGAGEVIAVENNPLACSTARRNARFNRVRNVRFIEGDVAHHLSTRFDVITANLYADLLGALLPRFRRALARDGRLILSGVMRAQEDKLLRSLAANAFDVLETRRRGKWLALLTSGRRR